LALCPFHNEKTPSFSISDDKGLYHCFGCGASGNAITFLKEYRKLTFRESLEELAKIAGIDLSKYSDDGEASDNRQKDRLYALQTEAMKYFYRNLTDPKGAENGDSVMQYLKGRNISPDMIKMFRIGYGGSSWQGLTDYLREQGYSEEEMITGSLAVKGKQGVFNRFKDRVVFPIMDIRDRIIGFGGRILTDDKTAAKYLNSGETPIFHKGSQLFALNFAKEEISRTGHALVVEGYMDVIALTQHGIKNAVAPLGTALTESQMIVLKRFCEDVTFIFDGDDAGVKAADRALDLTAQSGTDIPHSVVILPNKMDPYDFVMSQGGKEFTEFVSAKKLEPIDFKIRFHAKRIDPKKNTVEFILVLFSYIEKLKNAVNRQKSLKSIADFLGEEIWIIKEEYNNYLQSKPIGKLVSPNKEVIDPITDPLKIEVDFLASIIADTSLIIETKKIIEPDMFINMEFRELYESLLNDLTEPTQGILARITSKLIIEKVSHYCMKAELNPGFIAAYRMRVKYAKIRMKVLRDEVSRLENGLKNEAVIKKINEINNEANNWSLEIQEMTPLISQQEV
jgi:DNA primase